MLMGGVCLSPAQLLTRSYMHTQELLTRLHRAAAVESLNSPSKNPPKTGEQLGSAEWSHVPCSRGEHCKMHPLCLLMTHFEQSSCLRCGPEPTPLTW